MIHVLFIRSKLWHGAVRCSQEPAHTDYKRHQLHLSLFVYVYSCKNINSFGNTQLFPCNIFFFKPPLKRRPKKNGRKDSGVLLPLSVSGRNGFTLITSLFLFSLRPGTFYYLYVALHKSQTRYKVNEYECCSTDEGNQQNPHNDTENFV